MPFQPSPKNLSPSLSTSGSFMTLAKASRNEFDQEAPGWPRARPGTYPAPGRRPKPTKACQDKPVGFFAPKSFEESSGHQENPRGAARSSVGKQICTTPSRCKSFTSFTFAVAPNINFTLTDSKLEFSAARIAVDPAQVPAKIFGGPNGHSDPGTNTIRVTDDDRLGASVCQPFASVVSYHEESPRTGNAADDVVFSRDRT